MYEETEYMSSQEQLVAFLDGELSPDETTTLFYELAQNPELQEEMRQHVSIKNTLRHSQLMPPPQLKNSILTTTGLKEGIWANFVDSTSKTLAILSAFLFNRTSFSVFAISLLSIGVILILNHYDSSVSENIVSNNRSGNIKQEFVDKSSNIPVMESSEAKIKSDNFDNNNVNIPLFNNKNNSDLSKVITFTVSNKNNLSLLSGNSNTEIRDINNQSIQNLPDDDFSTKMNTVLIDRSSYLGFYGNDFKNNSNLKYQKVRILNGDLFSDFMQNTTFYIRKFNATSFPEFNVNNETNPIVNDINFGFKYNFDSHHSLGVSGGIENFRMSFDKNVDGIIYRYNQSWNGGWIGLNYAYNLGEISNSGIRPDVSILAGLTATGPIFRSGINFNYYLTENFYFNTGLEAVLLAYRESQSNSAAQWYSTSKVGFNIGFGVGF